MSPRISLGRFGRAPRDAAHSSNLYAVIRQNKPSPANPRSIRPPDSPLNGYSARMIPHCDPPPSPGRDDRAISGFSRDDPGSCRIAILGVPGDLGVELNAGRTGAREGPAALRAALESYGVRTPASGAWPSIFDAGDVRPGQTLQETHQRITDAVGELLDLGLFPIVIGGGHDLTYPVVRAVSTRYAPLHGVYFDAHLDVRETEGSGMAFRKIVEECGVQSLHVHGLHALANSREHQTWFESHGGRADRFGPGDPWPDGDLFVSLDLDVIDQAYAPGVSAMNPCGWTPDLAERWIRAAAKQPGLRCLDIVELCPPHDEHSRTARLCAHLLLSFCQQWQGERP